MIEHDQIRLDLCCAARLLYRNGLSAANAGHISVAIGGNRMLVNHFARAKSEIARIPAIASLWQDFIERLHKSDPDLFAGNP